MATDDTIDEATAIFTRAVGAADAGRVRNAVMELRAELRDAARAGGLEALDDNREENALILHHAGRPLVRVVFYDEGVRIFRFDAEGGRDPESALIPFKYRADQGAFVDDTAADDYRHPEPGTPRRKRPAAAVVAERIAKLIK